jgi:hypothetical protein
MRAYRASASTGLRLNSAITPCPFANIDPADASVFATDMVDEHFANEADTDRWSLSASRAILPQPLVDAQHNLRTFGNLSHGNSVCSRCYVL